MPSPFLIKAKIQLPSLRKNHISRLRLHNQIQAHQQAQIVLVSAPAGYGKSAFLAEWAHQLKADDIAVGWYALDERDNDPTRFANYLQSAFRVSSDAFEKRDNAETARLQETVQSILNDVSAYSHPVVLMLDDYHLIDESEIHDAMGLLAEYLPSNMWLAIGTRADPPLQLARLRAQGKITEIRMADLQFTHEEITNWIQTSLGWIPTDNILKQLNELTEGWAVALALIIMRQDQTRDGSLEKQLAEYSRTHQHIFDYLAEEVLEQQASDFRDFLLDTCVLNRLNPQICCILTNNESAPLLLNQVADNSLFVIPLSVEDPVYRYHHLFENFLCQYLKLHDPQRFYNKHQLAATWHAENGDIVEAVSHAFNATDYGYAAKIIEESAWETLTSRGEIMTAVKWIPSFPHSELLYYPRLCLYFSRALYLIGDAKQSQHYLEIAIETLNDETIEIQDRDALKAIAYNYQATWAAYRGNIQSALNWIKQSKALIDYVDGVDHVRIANTHAFVNYLAGNTQQTRQAYIQALALANNIKHDYLMLDAHYYLALTDWVAGDLDAVKSRCEDVLAQYNHPIGPLSTLMLVLGMVYYERNKLVQAERQIRDAITLAQRTHIPDVLWLAEITLADVLLAQGEFSEAENCIAKATQYTSEFNSPIIKNNIAASHARLMLNTNRLETAYEWATDYQATNKVESHQDDEQLILAQVWIAHSEYENALNLLQTIINNAESDGRIRYLIQAEILRAIAHQAQNNPDVAQQSIHRALRLASPHNFVRLFLDFRDPIIKLLRQVATSSEGDSISYAQYLLDKGKQDNQSQHPADVLTEREIEVLEQIATGASNNEIATELVISLGTVKSHIHHIMNKLNAQNRTEAVAIAQSLNLLAD